MHYYYEYTTVLDARQQSRLVYRHDLRYYLFFKSSSMKTRLPPTSIEVNMLPWKFVIRWK